MSDDIVERLRKAEVAGVLIPCDDLKEAADEIERLREENRNLIAALSEPRSHTVKYIGGGGWGGSGGGAGGPANFSET